MARTTEEAVKAILAPGRDYNTEEAPSLTGAIDTAGSMVDDLVAMTTADGLTYTPAKLELIERWLAAWAHCMSNRTTSMRSGGGSSSSFDGQTAMKLDANMYGQTAKMLDPYGYLGSELASLEWLGKPERDKISYSDRNE